MVCGEPRQNKRLPHALEPETTSSYVPDNQPRKKKQRGSEQALYPLHCNPVFRRQTVWPWASFWTSLCCYFLGPQIRITASGTWWRYWVDELRSLRQGKHSAGGPCKLSRRATHYREDGQAEPWHVYKEQNIFPFKYNPLLLVSLGLRIISALLQNWRKVICFLFLCSGNNKPYLH